MNDSYPLRGRKTLSLYLHYIIFIIFLQITNPKWIAQDIKIQEFTSLKRQKKNASL